MENLFVIFAPGFGGNHLANIISTSSRFQKRFNNSTYNLNKLNAHPTLSNNLDFSKANIDQYKKHNNVYCSHLAEYLWQKNFIELNIPNRKFVMIEFSADRLPKVIQQRLSKKYDSFNSYEFNELSTLYSLEIFSKLTNEQDLTSLNVELIFNQDIAKLLIHLKQELGLDVDESTVYDIHNKWLVSINKINI